MATQKELLQAVWRKAIRQDEPLRIQTKSKSCATKLRFDLYNAVRDFRSGKMVPDETLQQAIENCSLAYDQDDPSVLVVRRKMDTDMMRLLTGLVTDEQDIVSDEAGVERTLAEALQRKLAAGQSEETPVFALSGERAVDRLFGRKGD